MYVYEDYILYKNVKYYMGRYIEMFDNYKNTYTIYYGITKEVWGNIWDNDDDFESMNIISPKDYHKTPYFLLIFTHIKISLELR